MLWPGVRTKDLYVHLLDFDLIVFKLHRGRLPLTLFTGLICMGWIFFLAIFTSWFWNHPIISSENGAFLAIWQLLDNVPFCPGSCDLNFALTLFLGTGWKFWHSSLSASAGTTHTSATRSQVRAWLHRFLVLHFLVAAILLDIGALRGEGFSLSMQTGGAGVTPAKLHAEEPPATFGFSTCRSFSSASKRSYRRAVRRATTHGYTWYRGQLCSADQLGAKPQPPISQTRRSHNVSFKPLKRRARLTVLNWNAGGLPAHDWDHLQQWLDHQDIALIAVQETHWRYTSEWLQSRYFAIHCGGDGHAGVLCLISRRLCSQNDISWTEIVPGRVVHIRIHGKRHHIDFVNVYQHIHHASRMDQRGDIWHQLQNLLSKLSTKNTLVLMGDFNTSLQRRTAAVGSPLYRHGDQLCTGPKHSDSFQMLNLLHTFDLIALNAGCPNKGPTYRFGEQHSRIDFICSRRHHADQTSMNVQYLWHFPLLGLSGAQHVPQICSILKEWHQSPPTPMMGWTRNQRLELGQQWQQPNERRPHRHDLC